MTTKEEDSPSRNLRSWTPTTTQQIQDAPSSCSFDVLDHVLEGGNDSLASELTPWLSQLKPARTQGDARAAEILSFLPAMMVDTTPTTSRGDCSLFISREARTQARFSQEYPTLAKLISSIEMTAQENLSHCIEFDYQQTSVQLAVYPGDGKSGYPKHCDRSKTPTKQGMQRIVTCVYYVTPHDWNADLDGGCLRVYCPNNDMEQKYHDVVPYSNRMVVFRSDIVDHQVMPSLQRERMALTIWLYGKVRDDFVAVPRRNLLLQPTINNDSSTAVDASTLTPPLTVYSDTSENDDKTIFVSIAAYRDSELGPTLRSLMATAQYPQRVHVGICLQVNATADESILQNLPHNEPWFDTNIKMITVEARHARGPCYARDLVQRLYQQEDFVLQTDSHMRFRPRWDSYLIEQIQKCSSPQKSMLTAYPVGYQLPNEIPNETRATLLVPWKFDSNGMLRQRGRLLEPRETSAPCHLYAAGFNFAFGSVVAEVPYDGGLQYLFFGEELSMAVRLYTHGYNLYAPPEQVCYHLWSRSHRPTPLQVSPKVKQQQEVQRKAARQVVLEQLRGEGRGLGTERTVADFAEALGVDFAAQTIDPEAPLGGLEVHEFAMDATTLAPDSLEGQVASLDVKTQARIMSFLSAMNA